MLRNMNQQRPPRDRIVRCLQLRDLEAELEAEQRRSRELAANHRKVERALNELHAQAEEDHRVRMELQEQVHTLVIRMKTLRRQLEEAVSSCVVSYKSLVVGR